MSIHTAGVIQTHPATTEMGMASHRKMKARSRTGPSYPTRGFLPEGCWDGLNKNGLHR